METRLKFLKKQNQLEECPIVCSLDVHTKNIYMYVLNHATGEILFDSNILGGFKSVLKNLEKRKIPKNGTMILYEAGTFGFYPYRLFKKRGYQCKIIAPNSIPRKKNLRKTDRYDATENANYHISNALKYVHVPSEIDEQSREILRYRFEQVWKITKHKQYIQAFIKRHGVVFDEGKSYWTKKHYNWLNTVQLPALARNLLDLKLSYLYELQEQLQKIDDILDGVFENDKAYKYLANIYSVLPGVGRVNAMVLVLEGQDLKRFRKPTALMSYAGLVPGKYASGTSDPHLRITKSGNKYLRTALVGIAKMYNDRRKLRTNKELSKLSEPLRSFLIKIQSRLNSRYKYLVSKGKNSNKARCAIARELCGFIWELIVKIEPTIGEEQFKIAA